jgi:hypothetical protein
MRLEAPDSGSMPASVNRYLLPKERQVISVRQHPALLISPLAATFGGLLAAIAATGISGGETPKLVAWLLLVFLILRFMLLVVTWTVQYIVVTNERMLFVTGLINRKVESVPRASLVNLTLDRSSQGRRLGYGTFTIGYGADRVVIDYIPYPEQLYLEINGLLYGDKPAAPDRAALTAYSGMVATAAGWPVANIQVRLGTDQTSSAADGSFQLSVPPDVYDMEVSHQSVSATVPEFSLRVRSVDLTHGAVGQRIMLPFAAVHVTVVDDDGAPAPGAALIVENTTATFDIDDDVTVTAVIRNQGGTSGASGVISYPSFVGAQAVEGYLTGAGGGPLTQVTIPAVRADSSSVTVHLEAPGRGGG